MESGVSAVLRLAKNHRLKLLKVSRVAHSVTLTADSSPSEGFKTAKPSFWEAYPMGFSDQPSIWREQKEAVTHWARVKTKTFDSRHRHELRH